MVGALHGLGLSVDSELCEQELCPALLTPPPQLHPSASLSPLYSPSVPPSHSGFGADYSRRDGEIIKVPWGPGSPNSGQRLKAE